MTSLRTEIESIAKVLIIDNRNTVLILTLGKHLKYPEKSYLPDLPGGIVDLGESERDAAIREAREECGISLEAKNMQLVYSDTAYYDKENKSVTKLLYLAHVGETPEVKLSWEHSGYAWVAMDELCAVELRPFFKEAASYVVTRHLNALL